MTILKLLYGMIPDLDIKEDEAIDRSNGQSVHCLESRVKSQETRDKRQAKSEKRKEKREKKTESVLISGGIE